MKTALVLVCLLAGCVIMQPEDRSNAKCAAEAKVVADAKARGLGPEWWRVFEGNAYDACMKIG